MVDVDLREYGKSDVYRLTASQRGALTEALPSLTIEPISTETVRQALKKTN